MNNENTLQLEFPEEQRSTGPVTCLDMIFANDEEWRKYFLDTSGRSYSTRSSERWGFPIGEDEDILALSDPRGRYDLPRPAVRFGREKLVRQNRKQNKSGGVSCLKIRQIS